MTQMGISGLCEAVIGAGEWRGGVLAGMGRRQELSATVRTNKTERRRRDIRIFRERGWLRRGLGRISFREIYLVTLFWVA